MTIKDEAAREAVTTLGLLTSKAIPTIASLLANDLSEHPRAIATRYRKEGEQISDAEKKALGIRRNGFLSRAALAEIAPAGLTEPLAAHEITLLRATFTRLRYDRVAQGEAMRAQLGPSFIGYLHDTLHRECPACIRLDGLVTDAANAKIMPPSDCAPGCSANYGIGPKIDWLADID
jgi:hypothetical protein